MTHGLRSPAVRSRHRHRKARARARRYASLLAFVLLACLTSLSYAHPAGTRSIDRYLYFQLTGDGTYRVAYRLDFAEVAAYGEIDALDGDHDHILTLVEQRRYIETRLVDILRSWVVEVNGERVVPSIVASHLAISNGQKAYETLQLSCELRVEGRAPSFGADETLHVHDESFFDHPGWRTIGAGEGLPPELPTTQEGRVEPPDGGIGSPLPRVFDARFVFPARAGRPGAARRFQPPWRAIAPAAIVLVLVVVRLARRRRPA